MSLKIKIDRLDSDDGLVIFRKPDGTKVNLILGKITQWSVKPPSKGFVFAPFSYSENFPGLHISNDKHYEISNGALASSFQLLEFPEKWLQTDDIPTAFDQYSKTFLYFQRLMKAGEINKIILSKIVRFDKSLNNCVFEIYDLLCERYPSAFIYLFVSQKSGVWIGATPELLLKKHGNVVDTVALAGTRPLSVVGEWRKKEIVEHEYVSHFITGVIEGCGIDKYNMKGPETVSAGSVTHLKTSFNFEVDDSFDIWNMATQLHPTPAISGFPKEMAVNLIVGGEPHQREYYSGFMGLIDDNSASLYVNLRCMKITANGASLYVGGGLTVDSDLNEEWLETEMKSKTLLSVLENIV